jgi:hypothetical protein
MYVDAPEDDALHLLLGILRLAMTEVTLEGSLPCPDNERVLKAI